MRRTERIHDPEVSLVLTGYFRQWTGQATRRLDGSSSWLVILTLEGTGHFKYKGGDLKCGRGDMTLLQPNFMHEYGADLDVGSWSLKWAHFHPRPHWREFLDWPQSGPGICRISLNGDWSAVEWALDRAHLASDEMLAMVALEEGLLLAQRNAVWPGNSKIDERIAILMQSMRSEVSRKWTMRDLASMVDLSVSRMGHLFQEETLTTPRNYLEGLRMERGRQLLVHTSMTVREIASEVGFDSEFYFSNRFQRQYGERPSSLRKRARNLL
jgi:AraC family transcriptional regulator, arabinose operon regulatory protein